MHAIRHSILHSGEGRRTPRRACLLTDLRGLPNVELHEGVLERDAYYDAIARSIVLIPYVPNFYQSNFRVCMGSEILRRARNRRGGFLDCRGGEILRQWVGVRGAFRGRDRGLYRESAT